MNITCLQESIGINHLLLLARIVAEIQLNMEISYIFTIFLHIYNMYFYKVHILQALFSNCTHLRMLCFSHEFCLLLPLVLFEKCDSLQSPWVFPMLQQWQTGMGGDALGSTGRHPTADKNHVPLRLHAHCLGDPFSKVVLLRQPRYS